MPVLVGCLALAFPRLALLLTWFFGGGYLDRAFDSFLWVALGWLFFPLTTLVFAYATHSLGAPGEVSDLGWVLVGLSAVSDLGLLGGMRKRPHGGLEPRSR